MSPGKASERGQVLIIEHPEGGQRVAAHVFDIEGGIAWLDSGWTENIGGHPAHIVTATFTPFDMGWGATRADGQDIFIEVHPDQPAQEGTREQARQALMAEFDILFR